MDFTSAYSCPVALRRSAGNGIYGICGMELLDIMTRQGELPDEKYHHVSDLVSSVHPALGNGVIWLNDEVTKYLNTIQRADVIWPLLPSVLGTGQTGIAEKEFHTHLVTKGLATVVNEETEEDPIFKLGTHLPLDRKGCFKLEEATEFFKQVVREFYSLTGTTPKQTDYTEEQIANLNEWLELRKVAPESQRLEVRDVTITAA